MLSDIRYPSLHAKKYDESGDLWQARVIRDWRFYFTPTPESPRLLPGDEWLSGSECRPREASVGAPKEAPASRPGSVTAREQLLFRSPSSRGIEPVLAPPSRCTRGLDHFDFAQGHPEFQSRGERSRTGRLVPPGRDLALRRE